MAVTSVQPGEKAPKEKSALENAAMLLGMGAQLGQLAFSASDAFKSSPSAQSANAPGSMNMAAAKDASQSNFGNALNTQAPAGPRPMELPKDKWGNVYNPKTGLMEQM